MRYGYWSKNKLKISIKNSLHLQTETQLELTALAISFIASVVFSTYFSNFKKSGCIALNGAALFWAAFGETKISLSNYLLFCFTCFSSIEKLFFCNLLKNKVKPSLYRLITAQDRYRKSHQISNSTRWSFRFGYSQFWKKILRTSAIIQ